MRKVILVFSAIMILGGCATTNTVRTDNRTNLLKLSIGMTKNEAISLMGTEEITTYQFAGVFTPFTGNKINNPYRSEILQGENKTFEVLYYYTDKKNADDAITDDELTPLIFDNGKLIGWGWSFLQENLQKYEIRIR